MIQNEAAFQQELLLFLPLTAVAIWLPVSVLLKALLICSLLFILFAEMANTAIEAAIDRIGTDYHPLSGLAKDIGSACVLVSFMIATIVWSGCVPFNRLSKLFVTQKVELNYHSKASLRYVE
ncbi:diacylglycerol kinase [Vibrio anguillarum]|nr:diacylglycerol kinase [Vibrio anguillarum]